MAENLELILQEKKDAGWQIQCETLGIRPGSAFADTDFADTDRAQNEESKHLPKERSQTGTGSRIAVKRLLNRLTEQNARIVAEYNEGITDRNAFSTDSNIPLSMGIPANTIGTAVGDGMHTAEEWIEMEGQKKGMRIAAEVIKEAIRLF